MPSYNKLSKYRTTWHVNEDDSGGVTYVSTQIVSWNKDTVTLNSNGWHTVTTKRKMTQAARQFALGYSVFQEKGAWYVRRLARAPEGGATWEGGVTFPYYDGVTFPRGLVTTMEKAT